MEAVEPKAWLKVGGGGFGTHAVSVEGHSSFEADRVAIARPRQYRVL